MPLPFIGLHGTNELDSQGPGNAWGSSSSSSEIHKDASPLPGIYHGSRCHGAAHTGFSSVQVK